MTPDERLRAAYEEGRLAERERIRLRVEALHQIHAAELLRRERLRQTRAGASDRDPMLHLERGAMQVLDAMLVDVAAPRDAGEDVTAAWIEDQLRGSTTSSGRPCARNGRVSRSPR